MNRINQLKRRIIIWISLFILLLLLSGITAFPLESELQFLVQKFPNKWITEVYTAIHEVNVKYPFLSYGTDWLAFAHIVIAVAFIGPLIDPVKNIWVIQWGMIACIMVFPLAFICGSIRHIPFYWQLIDCSFGLLGLSPLYICYRTTKTLEQIINNNV